ncbi:hypothetical protein MYU51_010391 [Penicillium brevicompactum]
MAIPVDLVEKNRLPYHLDGTRTIHIITDTKRNRGVSLQEWNRDRKGVKGGFGYVWREVLVDRETIAGPPVNKRFRAVKEILKEKVPDQLLRRELKAIATFSQPEFRKHFVQSYGWFETPTALFIAMEWFENGDLTKYLKQPLPVPGAKKIAIQILEGLYHMHDQGFTHRDLKPANLLVVTTQPWQVKIADFGLSKQVLGDSTALRTEAGTQPWMAPEYFIRDPGVVFTRSVDIWSFGAVVFNMVTGQKPFQNFVDIMEYGKGRSNIPELDLVSDKAGAGEECVDFLKRTMAPKPEDRLGAYDCLKHPWLKVYRNDSDSLTRGANGSSPKSSDSLGNLTRSSQGKISEVGSDINDSSPTANWENIDQTKIDQTKIREETESTMRETTNGIVKLFVLPLTPEINEAIASDADRTALQPKRSNVTASATERSLAFQANMYFSYLMLERLRVQEFWGI